MRYANTSGYTLGLLLSLLTLFSCGTVIQQTEGAACATGYLATPGNPVDLRSGEDLLVAFYNVENLFDTVDAPYEGDDFILTEPEIDWRGGDYTTKLSNLAKAISSIGDKGPDVLGLAEVENACVIADLLRQPALAKRGYRIVHEESPDRRGIDVALIYDPKTFQYGSYSTFEVAFDDPHYQSREILAVQGEVNGQSLFLLVNHWPSRGGGQQETEPRRMAAARTARELVDRIQDQAPEAGVLLMGDFNDDPHDRSMTQSLGAAPLPKGSVNAGLYNTTYHLLDPEEEGSLTYRGSYNLFDQVILNAPLINGTGALRYQAGSARIHHPDFMRFRGRGPSRAIHRRAFKPYGFSDHFPVYLRLQVK